MSKPSIMNTFICIIVVLIAATTGIITVTLGSDGIKGYRYVTSLPMENCYTRYGNLAIKRSSAKMENVTLSYINMDTISIIYPPPGMTNPTSENINKWVNEVTKCCMISCYYDIDKKIGFISHVNWSDGIIYICIGLTFIIAALGITYVGFIQLKNQNIHYNNRRSLINMKKRKILYHTFSNMFRKNNTEREFETIELI